MSDNNNLDRKQFEYAGFKSPNGTIVPDDLFDVLMPQLKDGELRVLLYIIRKTFGWKKVSDDISLSQMVNGVVTKDGRVQDRGTGLKKSAVTEALKGLRAKKIIKAVRNQSVQSGNEPTTYMLRFEGEPDEVSDVVKSSAQSDLVPLSVLPDKGLSADMDRGLSGKTDRQETFLQITEISLSEPQKSTRSNHKKPDQKGSNRNNDALPENPPVGIEAESVQPTVHHGMESVGESLQRKLAALTTEHQATNLSQPGRRRKRKPDSLSHDEYDDLIRMVKDYARQNGGADEYNSHVTHACNIIEQTGCSYSTFYGAAIEAQRQLTAKRMKTHVEKPMAYWFVCLETELQIRPRRISPNLAN